MKIGFFAGCFTILTAGHVDAFRRAKDQCDELWVLTNQDEYVKNKKGCVPVPVMEKMQILRSVKYVDEVLAYKEMTEEDVVIQLIDDNLTVYGSDTKFVIFHSQEMKQKHVNGERVPCEGIVDEIIYLENAPTKSVSDIFETIRAAND